MSDNGVLWNTLDTLLTGLAKEVEDSLEEENEQPPDWSRIRRDLDIATMLVRMLS